MASWVCEDRKQYLRDPAELFYCDVVRTMLWHWGNSFGSLCWFSWEHDLWNPAVRLWAPLCHFLDYSTKDEVFNLCLSFLIWEMGRVVVSSSQGQWEGPVQHRELDLYWPSLSRCSRCDDRGHWRCHSHSKLTVHRVITCLLWSMQTALKLKGLEFQSLVNNFCF